ncbi:MAG: D,D-dipeptide ABC transporter permease, partial [Deltaproteobacteria bacterium]|nr:D,D-dipeptide ABC transporter permease [Deltaproteobacteria bacterium]
MMQQEGNISNSNLRGWLLSPAPRSRSQARLGRA